MSNTAGPAIFKGMNNQSQHNIKQNATTAKNGRTEAEKQEEMRQLVMPYFVNFALTNEISLILQKYGKKVAPLQLIGTFLSYTGNAMLNDIWQRYQRKVFYGNSKAIKITQVSETVSGDQRSATWMTEVHFNLGPANQRTFIRSKNIVMACGAEQVLPMNVRLKCGIPESALVYSSDQVLKQEGYQNLVKKIHQMQGRCKIFILGGSHSAFSVLNILLKGPCRIRIFEEYKRINKQHLQQFKSLQQKKNNSVSSPDSKKKSAKCKGKEDSQKKSQPQIGMEQMHLGPKGYQMNFCQDCAYCHLGLMHSKLKTCSCGNQCHCLGNPQIPPSPRSNSSPQKDLGSSPASPVLQGNDHITILYRNQIKVHFSTVQQAQKEMYNSFDQKLDLSQGGIVYPFTGIRGDAKDIWTRVNKGLEPHASFVRADTLEEQKQYLQQADIVIFACGYQSKQVPIFDTKGQQIHLASNLYFQESTEQALAKRQQNGTQPSGQFVVQGSNSGLNQHVKPAALTPNTQYQQKMRQSIVKAKHNGHIQREYVDVNTNCQLLNARQSNQPIPGLYGIGQGFSLSTSDHSVQAELRPGGKADSVGLYIKQIGNKILSQLFPGKPIQYLMPIREIDQELKINGNQIKPQNEQNKNGTLIRSPQNYGNEGGAILSNHNNNGMITVKSLMPGGGGLNHRQQDITKMSNMVQNSKIVNPEAVAQHQQPRTQEHYSSKIHGLLGQTHQGFGNTNSQITDIQKPQTLHGHGNIVAGTLRDDNHLIQNQSNNGFTSISELLGARNTQPKLSQQQPHNAITQMGNYQNGGRLSLQQRHAQQNSFNSVPLSYHNGYNSEDRQRKRNVQNAYAHQQMKISSNLFDLSRRIHNTQVDSQIVAGQIQQQPPMTSKAPGAAQLLSLTSNISGDKIMRRDGTQPDRSKGINFDNIQQAIVQSSFSHNYLAEKSRQNETAGRLDGNNGFQSIPNRQGNNTAMKNSLAQSIFTECGNQRPIEHVSLNANKTGNQQRLVAQIEPMTDNRRKTVANQQLSDLNNLRKGSNIYGRQSPTYIKTQNSSDKIETSPKSQNEVGNLSFDSPKSLHLPNQNQDYFMQMKEFQDEMRAVRGSQDQNQFHATNLTSAVNSRAVHEKLNPIYIRRRISSGVDESSFLDSSQHQRAGGQQQFQQVNASRLIDSTEPMLQFSKDAPLSDKTIPLSDNGHNNYDRIPIQNAIQSQPRGRYHKNTISVNGSFSGEIYSAITTGHRDFNHADKHDLPFRSPYVNMSKTRGQHFENTPNRQNLNAQPRISYGSGGDTAGGHILTSDDFVMNNQQKATTNNFIPTSYIKSSYMQVLPENEGRNFQNTYAFASSKPVTRQQMAVGAQGKSYQGGVPSTLSHSKSSSNKKRIISGATVANNVVMGQNILNSISAYSNTQNICPPNHLSSSSHNSFLSPPTSYGDLNTSNTFHYLLQNQTTTPQAFAPHQTMPTSLAAPGSAVYPSGSINKIPITTTTVSNRGQHISLGSAARVDPRKSGLSLQSKKNGKHNQGRGTATSGDGNHHYHQIGNKQNLTMDGLTSAQMAILNSAGATTKTMIHQTSPHTQKILQSYFK